MDGENSRCLKVFWFSSSCLKLGYWEADSEMENCIQGLGEKQGRERELNWVAVTTKSSADTSGHS